jgi:type IV pilus assembly protein PilP
MPLEQFEVNDFELAAVISGPGMRMAMVQDPTGKGYFIQVGSRIGKKGGTVVSITDKEVIIEEPYRDFMGRKSSRKTTLKMYTRAAVPAPEEKK